MSENKFTPGPWSHRAESTRHIIFIERPIGEAALAAIGMTAGTFHDSLANARLIAAAPELYEALASLLQDVEEYVRLNNLAGSDGKPASNDAMDRARAALLKATPEQSDV